VSHVAPADSAQSAYASAFSDPDCLKMILDWRASA
ncbi:MAG: chlorophyll synthesis pathway protein BchC, partial [Pseudomonadota bacterium]